MRLGIAIERLFDNYVYASDKEWIRDKVAWALYQTWKEVESRKNEPQTDGYMTVEQTEDYRKMLNKAEHNIYGNIEDEPQTMYYPQIDGITPNVIVQCYLRESCDHYGDKQVCGRCREYNLYSHTKTEPQTDCSKTCPSIDIYTRDDTDCAWRRGE